MACDQDSTTHAPRGKNVESRERRDSRDAGKANDSQRSAQQNQNKITFVANGDCKFHALLVGWNIFSLERVDCLRFSWNEDRDRAPLPNLWTSPLPIRTWFSGQRKTKFPDSTEPAPWQDVHNLREGTPTNRFTNVFCGLLLSKKQAVGQSPSWNEPLDPTRLSRVASGGVGNPFGGVVGGVGRPRGQAFPFSPRPWESNPGL